MKIQFSLLIIYALILIQVIWINAESTVNNENIEDDVTKEQSTTTNKLEAMTEKVIDTTSKPAIKVENQTSTTVKPEITTKVKVTTLDGKTTKVEKQNSTDMTPKSTIKNLVTITTQVPNTTTKQVLNTTTEEVPVTTTTQEYLETTSTKILYTTTTKESVNTTKKSTTQEPEATTKNVFNTTTTTKQVQDTTTKALLLLTTSTQEPETTTTKQVINTTTTIIDLMTGAGNSSNITDKSTTTTKKTSVSTITESSTSTAITTITTMLPLVPSIAPKRCPVSYTGSQCNYQTYWCPSMICLGSPKGHANCFRYVSYDCKCTSNISCKIENAEPSFLNGNDCFDINRVNKNKGVYYNYYAEFYNYNNDNIGMYTCGCKPNFGRKNVQNCEISSCANNVTNPCSSNENCFERSALSNGLNFLYCSCPTGGSCLKTESKNCTNICADHAKCHSIFTNSYFTANFNSFDLKDSFMCKCNSTNATDCYKEDDPCANKQCLNGGTCVSVNKRGRRNAVCLCAEGTTGRVCESFLKCLEPSKQGRESCFFGGKCIYSLEDYYLGNEYTCECREGFTGKFCNECPPDACENGGRCSLNSDGNVNCKCQYGYKGKRCETRYDFCEFNDDFHCDNVTGECAAYKDYYCNCSASAGKCEMQTCHFATGCVSTGKTCLAPPDFHSYGCNCYMFSRSLYENAVNGRCNLGNMDSCNERIFSVNQNINWYYDIVKNDHFCLTNQNCKFGFDSYLSYYNYFCECRPGEQCYKIRVTDPCSESLCNTNASTCMAFSQVDKYFCKCHENTTAEECHLETHPCLESPCQNGGTCLARIDPVKKSQVAFCLCPKGASGKKCENLNKYCSIPFCGAHGKCESNHVGHFKCHCDSGYSGRYCDQKIESCDPNPCLNDGECSIKEEKTVCECQDAWVGDFCEINSGFAGDLNT